MVTACISTVARQGGGLGFCATDGEARIATWVWGRIRSSRSPRPEQKPKSNGSVSVTDATPYRLVTRLSLTRYQLSATGRYSLSLTVERTGIRSRGINKSVDLRNMPTLRWER